MKLIRQISYWTIGGFGGEKPLVQALRETQEMGYDGMEPAFGAGCLAPGVSEADCTAARREAEKLGLKMATVCSGTYWTQSLSDPRAEVRKKAVEYTKEYLLVAKRLGAKTVLVVPGAVAVPWDASQPVVPYAEVWKNSAQSLRKCVPLAEKLGINLALENVWNWFLADPVAMREFVDQFESPRVGVYFDVANCLINGYPEHWLTLLGKRVKAIHVKNFSRSDCGGGIHGFGDDLLKGDADWKAIGAAMQKIKYSGPVTAEMIPFSRLPDLVLPDMKLARDTAGKLKKILY